MRFKYIIEIKSKKSNEYYAYEYYVYYLSNLSIRSIIDEINCHYPKTKVSYIKLEKIKDTKITQLLMKIINKAKYKRRFRAKHDECCFLIGNILEISEKTYEEKKICDEHLEETYKEHIANNIIKEIIE